MSTAITNTFHAYLQVDYADDPYTVLGLSQSDAPSAAEVKAAYHLLALYLHPDKAPSDDLVDASSRIFPKLQHAQAELLTTSSATPIVSTYKAILEGPVSLHQRNLAFKAALRERREVELQKKRELDEKKALDKALTEKKSETIAKARSDRPAEKFANHHGGTIEEAVVAIADIIQKRAEPKPEWRQGRDLVNRAIVKSRRNEKKDKRQKQRNHVAEETEEAIDVEKHDFVLALPEDMGHRHRKQLFSRKSGNVSAADRKRLEKGAAAKELEVERWELVSRRLVRSWSAKECTVLRARLSITS